LSRGGASAAQGYLRGGYSERVRPLPHLLLWAIGLRAAETQTTAEERAALARCAKGRTPIVEIGVWHGVTTAVLRQAMRDGGVLWAVDPFPAGRLGFNLQKPLAEAEVRRVRNGTVRWSRTSGQAAAAEYKREQGAHVALIFIDGDHSYEGLSGDWFAWKPLVGAGGLVCLHDSRSTAARDISTAGSVMATNEIVLKDPDFELIEQVDSLTVVRKL
jgi:predicted O-methyltransferase YrrM